MKKLLISLLFTFAMVTLLQAQDNATKAVAAFPYQKSADVQGLLSSMESWGKADWKKLLSMLDDDSLKLKATYALNAYTHHIALNASGRTKLSSSLTSSIKTVKTGYAKDLMIQELGLLGDANAIKSLSKLLKDEVYCGAAARALATFKTEAATAALNKALSSSKAPLTQHIQAAIDNANFKLPVTVTSLQPSASTKNNTQQLLDLQDQMVTAKNPVQQRNILAKADHLSGLGALMFAGKYLTDPNLKKQAALIVARIGLKDKTLSGKAVRDVLQLAQPLISGKDSAILVNKLRAHLNAMPYDHGFVSLFNGKDLTGWKGLVGNPVSRSKMSEQELLLAEAAANTKAQQDWVVKDGLLIFTGHGDNLCTVKKYGDFEMYVDWKITEKGDAGIYLRGSPQVQIWDTSRREVGAQVGSGGLYNNQKNQRMPLSVADNKVGEWNTFHITMIGEKVSVELNGVLVTDNVVLENYWDRKIPIFMKEQIELQAHGTYVAYRNIYVREIPGNLISVLSDEEKQQGFEMLFDGSNLNNWIGNKTGYLVENGTMVVNPAGGSGGNLYTAKEYGDFEYRFEFQLTPGANNGLGIRTPTEGDAAYVGMELQILDNEADIYKNLNVYQYHGSVYGVIPAKRGFLKPVGEWNEEVVVAKGSKIKVILNGQVIMDGDIKEASKNGTADHKDHPGLHNPKGHIGFLGHGSVVRFRNIRVKTL
ncbi:MAG: DUF1080 domain-containing protein [Chitinophagaceae bacterium]|nr:DUF1080 domain-containing protein [Chitinophagaceae bacterium]